MDHTSKAGTPNGRSEDTSADVRKQKYEEYMREMTGEPAPSTPDPDATAEFTPVSAAADASAIQFKTVHFEDDGSVLDETESLDGPNWETPEPDEDDEPPRKKKKKKKGCLKKILIFLLILILVAAIGAGVFVYRKLNLIDTSGDDFTGYDTMENDIDADDIDSITDASSLQALLREWATNDGDKMTSKYVKNVLLIGIDSDSKLSDSMILASVNVRTEEISLVSFYRDSYTYIDDKDGGYFAKLNASYNTGGAELVCETIENDYKITVDDYALVGYSTFPKVIDALGGVDVKVTEKEANYLNRTWQKWSRTGKKIQFKAGKMHMDGEHALMFCRIRGLDSDVGRTERQRRVIVSVIKQFKNSSVKTMNKTVNTLLPSIKTNLTKSAILDYVSEGVSAGWAKYDIQQMSMPTEDTCLPGYAGDQWIWICDFEAAAQMLQMKLYGQTNVTLDVNRVSALDFAQGETSATTDAIWTGSAQTSYSYIYYTTGAVTGTEKVTGYTSGSGSGGSTYSYDDPEDDPDYYTTAPANTTGTTRRTSPWSPWFGGGDDDED